MIILILIIFGSTVDFFIVRAEIECIYTKIDGYSAMDCSRGYFQNIPKPRVNVEFQVLNVFNNRLEKLQNDTFQSYKSLKILNLKKNLIREIESHTFVYLSQLEILDLSRNDMNYGDWLFHLPSSLKKFYLNWMDLANPNSSQLHLPFSSLKNLQVLSLRGCSLRNVPSFEGVLPSLTELDLTNNSLDHFSINDMAPLCGLKQLRLSPEVIRKMERSCECANFQDWITNRNMEIALSCTQQKGSNCQNVSLSSSAINTYNSCISEMKSQKLLYWLKIVGCILGVVCSGLFLIWLFYKFDYSKRSYNTANTEVPIPEAKPS